MTTYPCGTIFSWKHILCGTNCPWKHTLYGIICSGKHIFVGPLFKKIYFWWTIFQEKKHLRDNCSRKHPLLDPLFKKTYPLLESLFMKNTVFMVTICSRKHTLLATICDECKHFYSILIICGTIISQNYSIKWINFGKRTPFQ